MMEKFKIADFLIALAIFGSLAMAGVNYVQVRDIGKNLERQNTAQKSAQSDLEFQSRLSNTLSAQLYFVQAQNAVLRDEVEKQKKIIASRAGLKKRFAAGAAPL